MLQANNEIFKKFFENFKEPNGLTVSLIIKQETRIDIHGHRTIDPFHEVAQNEEALVQNKIERQTAPLQLLGNFTCSSSSAQLIF